MLFRNYTPFEFSKILLSFTEPLRAENKNKSIRLRCIINYFQNKLHQESLANQYLRTATKYLYRVLLIYLKFIKRFHLMDKFTRFVFTCLESFPRL